MEMTFSGLCVLWDPEKGLGTKMFNSRGSRIDRKNLEVERCIGYFLMLV